MASIINVEDARKAVAPLNQNLDAFQFAWRGSNGKLKLNGEALFALILSILHMILGKSGKQCYEGSQHLELLIWRQQMDFIVPVVHNLQKLQIIKDTVGDGLKMKVAMRKLNIIGNVHSKFTVLNIRITWNGCETIFVSLVLYQIH